MAHPLLSIPDPDETAAAQATRGVGPQPRAATGRRDWLILGLLMLIWGVVTGSPTMRPHQAAADQDLLPVKVQAPAKSFNPSLSDAPSLR